MLASCWKPSEPSWKSRSCRLSKEPASSTPASRPMCSQSWVASGRLSMGLAMLGLHGGVFALALALLWWRDHAAVTRIGRRPARRVAA